MIFTEFINILEPEKKWGTFFRHNQHFLMHFLEWKLLVFFLLQIQFVMPDNALFLMSLGSDQGQSHAW